MKKAQIILAFLIFSGAIFTVEAQNRRIFFEGTADRSGHQVFFLENFKMEAEASGYTVAYNKNVAGYTFSFRVVPNIIVYEDGTEEPAPPDEPQFNIIITFISNEDDVELVVFDFPFSELEEMLGYTQYLFLRAAVFIPPLDENSFLGNNDWQNMWLYLRLSAGFPVIFYQLISNTSAFNDKFIAQPDITLGAEVQFLNFMSLEAHIQAGWEYLNDNHMINTAVGAELKFPIKYIRNVTLTPYGAFSFPIHIPSVPISIFDLSEYFSEYPLFAFGGGFEVGIKGFKSGSFFFDVNYLYYYGDAIMKNPSKDQNATPRTVTYQRHALGFGFGYKFGFFKRK